MIPFGGLLSDNEIWTVIQYERSFADGHGRGGMGRHRGKGPRQKGDGMRNRGRHGRMGSGEHHGGMDKEACCQKSE